MKNPAQEILVGNAMIAGIEDAVDSANLLSLDLAIHAFANDEDRRAFVHMPRKLSNARSGEVQAQPRQSVE